MGMDPLMVPTLPRASVADTVQTHVPSSVNGGPPVGLMFERVALPAPGVGFVGKSSGRDAPVGLAIDPDGRLEEGFSSATATCIPNAYNVPAPTLYSTHCALSTVMVGGRIARPVRLADADPGPPVTDNVAFDGTFSATVARL